MSEAIPDQSRDGFEDVYFSAPDGLRLHARDYGRKSPRTIGRLPLICLPGLSRNVRDFHQFARIIAEDRTSPRRVVSFDYRGRGGSDWARSADEYTIVTEAEDCLAGMAALGIGHAVMLGTSRGGLIMHVLAATRPAVIAGAILNDIGPAIETEGLVRIRTYLSRARRPANWQEAAAIQQEIHGADFPALSPDDWRDFARAIFVEEGDRLEADFDPRLLAGLREVDQDTVLPTMWPQFESLAANRPLMVLRGEHSKLLSEETVAEMKRRAPHIETHTVDGQGHTPILHLGGLPALIQAFLLRCDAAHGH